LVDLITTLLLGTSTLLLGILGNLVAYEVTLHYRKWSKAIVYAAAKRIPEAHREAYLEQSLADLDDCIGLFASFRHAIGCWTGAPQVAAAYSPKPVVGRIRTALPQKAIKSVQLQFQLMLEALYQNAVVFLKTFVAAGAILVVCYFIFGGLPKFVERAMWSSSPPAGPVQPIPPEIPNVVPAPPSP